MKKFKHILNYKNLIIPASFISAVVLSFSVITPTVASVKKEIDTHENCVKTIFPDNVERDIVVDADAGLIYVGYYHNGTKKDITLSLEKDSKFSECSDSVRELVILAKKNSDKIDTDTCKEFTKIASSVQSIPEVDGKKMNMVAVGNYLNKHCK